MPTPSVITDPKTGNVARVTKFGQLVAAPLDYSVPIEVDLVLPGVAFNFLEPVPGESIVITDIIVSSNKDVSQTDPAEVDIFEADTVDSTIANPRIIKPQLTRSSNLTLNGLNLLVPEGKYINATTTDATIILTIMFYRVPVKDL